MTKIDSGFVDITLDGEGVTLKPTLQAAQNLSRAFGGVAAVFPRLQTHDIDAFAKVIVEGAGLTGAAAKAVPAKVFATGLTSLIMPLTEFLLMLSNGGKPLGDEEDATPGEASVG